MRFTGFSIFLLSRFYAYADDENRYWVESKIRTSHLAGMLLKIDRMKYKYMRRFLGVCMVISLWVLVHSCANMATPNGGPYDEDPPKFISSTPAPNETNFRGKKIEILFDELIQIENPNENVIITPPQLQLPVIRAAGKKVVVELKDTLMDNTTYTIDFANSIADNNEKNVLENFSFAFATGEIIDSLEISGILLNAENLEPMPSVTIGLHQNLEDSAFVKDIFIRTSRTNEKGRFMIRNIAPGTYRIYALNDLNRDYRFDQPGEDIAFGDSLIFPSFEYTSRQDTIWQDSLTVDTVYTIQYTRFLPDDILLRLFKEEFQRQYMLRPERTVANRFTLRFNAPLDEIPDPVPLNFTPPDPVWYFPQLTEEGKSVHYWIMDSTVWARDTLQFEVNYLKSDSLNILQPQLDTVTVAMRQRPADNRKKKKEEEEPLILLGMNIDASGTKDMTDTISIVFDEPVLDLTSDLFYLSIQEDTLWVPIEFDFFPNEEDPMTFHILRRWNYGEAYKLEVDSATIFSLYGKWNDAYEGEFKIRNEDEYGHLYINITGVEPPAFVELLNSSDAPIRKAVLKDGGVLFMDLKPAKYYARIILDRNENGVWGTGNYAEKLQPEEVFYYPKEFDIKQNWQVEEYWNVNETPLPNQKPLDITKNKPKEVTQRNRDYRNEGRR